MIYKIFIAGFFIIGAAVLANLTASYLEINTWYVFLDEAGKEGFLPAVKNQGILSLIFLFLVYPFILGSAGYLVFHWLG